MFSYHVWGGRWVLSLQLANELADLCPDLTAGHQATLGPQKESRATGPAVKNAVGWHHHKASCSERWLGNAPELTFTSSTDVSSTSGAVAPAAACIIQTSEPKLTQLVALEQASLRHSSACLQRDVCNLSPLLAASGQESLHQ